MLLRINLNSEKIALGVLALFLSALAALLWVLDSSHDEAKIDASTSVHYSSASVTPGRKSRRLKGGTGEEESEWTADVDYSSGSGNILVDLRHRILPADKELKVWANFRSPKRGEQVDSRWLSRQKNGVFSGGDLHLSKGNWTMGLTGYHRSNLTFKLEQELVVE